MATQEKKRTLLTETPGVFKDVQEFQNTYPSKQVLTDAINDSKQVRVDALKNARAALENAFGPKLNQKIKEALEAPQQSAPTETTIKLSLDDLEKMLLDLGMELAENDDMVKECRKRLEEARDPSLPETEKARMYKDIHRKFFAYLQSLPKVSENDNYKPSDTDKAVRNFLSNKNNNGLQWISHEGSTIVCALLAVSQNMGSMVTLSQLPEGDRTIIEGLLKPYSVRVYPQMSFSVEFDEYKNFNFCLEQDSDVKPIMFSLGNRVASIPPSESSRFGNCEVKVERKGKEILIGDRIKLEKNRIQNLVQPTEAAVPSQQKAGFQPRQKVAGRNAYEIRADVLEMALDWAKHSSQGNMNEDDVLAIADAFYSFVEHK